MEWFGLRTKICFGEGALESLRGVKGKRFFLVTDPYFMKNGLAAKVGVLCPGKVEIFSGVVPDPPLAVVVEGACRRLLRNIQL